MENEKNKCNERQAVQHPEYTPIRAFRFILDVSGLEKFKVSYVRSLPGRQLEVGYYITEEGPTRMDLVGLQGEVMMLNADGEVLRTLRFKAEELEWLPCQFDYADNGNLVQRFLFKGVIYNP